MPFPEALDSFSDPVSGPVADGGTRMSDGEHAKLHRDVNTAVEALEAKVGVDSSAVVTSHDYRIGALEAFGFTSTKVSNWDTAYSWGNHSGLYALLNHNHDLLYAALNHNHAGVYSPVGHDHAGVYDLVGAGAGAVSTHESTYDHTLIATAVQADKLKYGIQPTEATDGARVAFTVPDGYVVGTLRVYMGSASGHMRLFGITATNGTTVTLPIAPLTEESLYFDYITP